MKKQKPKQTQTHDENALDRTTELITMEDLVEQAVYAAVVPNDKQSEEEMFSLLGAEIVNTNIGFGGLRMT